ncbi:MAG: Na/Pi cotransporter family protein, partial [Bacteroidales bacterium]
GGPLVGLHVAFRIRARPDQAEGAILTEGLVLTDSSGLASTGLTLGSQPGLYRVSCRTEEGFPDNEVVFTAKASKRNWVWMLIIGLFGGLGLFLFGMNTMSDGLQQSAGERMRSILEHVTRNRVVGVGIGTVVTAIIQSSSATSVMLVSFVNAGLIRFRQTIPVLLGAAIGTTITAQIIAFKITEYSLLLVALGYFLQIFSRKEAFKSVGNSLFGFGVLFFGMSIMSDAMAPLREWSPFIDLLLRLENPLLGILVGAAFTALIQSSSAFVGIMIVLASQGLLSLDASIPLLLGSNLGTTVTALLSSMKARQEARKVALAFLMIKFFSVLIFAGWTAQLGRMLIQFTPEASLPRLIANAHTFINVGMTLLLLPFTPQLAWLVDRIAGKAKLAEKPAFSTLYLDRSMIGTASLALNLAKQEIIRMARIVQSMYSQIITPFLEKDGSPLNLIYSQESEVNYLRDEIKSYLLNINREQVSSQRVNESFLLLYSLNEYEKIADIISGNLANRAEKWLARGYVFSDRGKTELKQFHEKIDKQLKRALIVFEEANLQQAEKMKEKHKEYRSMSQELEKQHYARIMEGMKESLESSETHLEILALLGTIDSHTTNIARIALDWDQKSS